MNKQLLWTTLLLPTAALFPNAAMPKKDFDKAVHDAWVKEQAEKDVKGSSDKGSLDEGEQQGATAANVRYFAEGLTGDKVELSKELVKASELLRNLSENRNEADIKNGVVFPFNARLFGVLKDSIGSFEQLLNAHKNALLLKKKNDKEKMAYLMENMRADLEKIAAAYMSADVQVFIKYGQISELAYYLGLPDILCVATQGLIIKASDLLKDKQTPEMLKTLAEKQEELSEAAKRTWNEDMTTGLWRAQLLIQGCAYGACSTVQDLIDLEYGVTHGDWLNFGVLGLTNLNGLSKIKDIEKVSWAKFPANPISEVTAQQVACMTALTSLDLCATYISTINADVIAALPQLETLNLGDCKNITSLPKDTIEMLAKLEHFKKLHVPDNPLDEATKKLLQEYLPGKYELWEVPWWRKAKVAQASTATTATTAAAASTNK